MIALVGTILLWIAIAGAVCGVLSTLLGLSLSHARTSIVIMTAALVGSLGLLLVAFLFDNLTIDYVRAHSNVAQPFAYKIAAVWAGQEGSLLLWSTLCSVVAAGVACTQRTDNGPAARVSLSGLAVIVALLVSIVALLANPFASSGRTFAGDGHGLDPMLRHWAMVVHPPIVLAGSAACLAPAMIVCGALWSKKTSVITPCVRQWSLVAWVLLGSGIVIGARWAYVEIGWGGYWNWDPVENASLLPWLMCTALVHTSRQPVSVRRDRWIIGLACGMMLSAVFGAWVTRSGMVPSVHAFAASSIGGWLSVVFIAAVLFVGLALLRAWRSPMVRHAASDQASASRAIELANVLLVWMACTVLVGMLVPLVSRMLGRGEIGVTHVFYARLFLPAAVACLVVMTVAPFMKVRGTADRRESAWTPRRAGVFLAHGGIVLMAIGVAGSTLFSEETARTLSPGESIVVGDRTVTLVSASQQASTDGAVVSAEVRLSHARSIYTLTPAQVFSAKDARPSSEVVIRSEVLADVYVALVGWDAGGARVAIDVRVIPLVSLIWWGSVVTAVGTAGAILWPQKHARCQTVTRAVEARRDETTEKAHAAPLTGAHAGAAS